MNISKKTMLTIVLFVTALIAESAMKTIYNYLYDINDIIEPKSSYSSTSSYDVTAESGITPAELQYRCGDMYEISQIEYEYSGQPAGTVSSVSIQAGNTKGGKIPLKMTLSLGNDPFKKNYFKNYTDPTEFLESAENGNKHLADVYLNRSYDLLYNKVTEEQIISYNEFYGSDRIRHRAIFYQAGSESSPYWWIIKQTDSGFCWREKVSSNSFKYDGDFTLQLEDYNNDGIPDYIYKADDPDKKGCRYILQYTDGESSLIYIYGETSDSPKLDRIDREHFFYLTKKNEYPSPIVLNANGETLDGKDYENNGWLFTSYYENGTISLNGTAAYTTARLTNEAEIAVKKLDELVWRNINVPQFNTEFSVNRAFESDTATIAKELEQGVYKIEVTINEKTTSTEFYVY
ncbi:MAG: hypothetical protein K2N72_05360 [Oscillospiraceae bacterium]|nr:hypothetical protein [Oscillospiraceae bacterium]